MRIGEIKNILENVINTENIIIIDYESIYGGQAYSIKNYSALITALEILSKQEWNKHNFGEIQQIINEFGKDQKVIILSQEQFNKLNAYVSSVNQQVPLFFTILTSLIEKQDEKTLNIKLPANVDNLQQLTEINKRLDRILKLFNVDGQFTFKSFDKGTNWYAICAVGFLSYQYIIHGLDIAKKFLETKETYYKSKKAELDYKASLQNINNFNNEDFDKYKERRLNLIIETKVQEAIRKIASTNGKSIEELQTQVIKGVKELVKELKEGTEFHLSLNPPTYIEGNIGSLNIDYTRIHQIQAEKQKEIEMNKPKIIENKNDSKDKNEAMQS